MLIFQIKMMDSSKTYLVLDRRIKYRCCISDIVKILKHLPSQNRIAKNTTGFGDVIEVVADSVGSYPIFDGDEATNKKKQQEKDISSLLSGPIKASCFKIKEANLSDEGRKNRTNFY